LKILQLSSAQALGGGERHLIDLANALVARGHEVHAAFRPASPLIRELARLPKDNLTTLPLRNALDAASARKLARYVREHKIEIVHAHLARDYPLAAFATRRNARCKLVITRHVLFPLNRLHAITLSAVARVIAVSGAVQRALLAQALLPADRVVVVHNGIDVQRFERASSQSARDTFRRQWNVSEGELLIGSVGEITPLKGHEDFLRAAAIILHHFSQAQFLIAGVDASSRRKNITTLESLIAQLNLARSVRIVGWVEDLTSLYGALDIFVSASHTESFGLAIAEAMASAVPVVATETEGAKEIITDGETGLLVPIADATALATAVLGLLQDTSKGSRLRMSGCKRIKEQFSLERMVDETEKLYREVLNGSASA
jgi:glycosyltransferase involved in cell wall biosynthesis